MPSLPKLIPSPRETAAVQLTAFSVDSYGRLVCSTLDEAWQGAHGAFDVIVIGSGMYGGYAAEKLYQLSGQVKPKVLVLETGHFVLPEHVDNLPRLSKDDVAFELGGLRGYPYLKRDPDKASERHFYCVGGKSIAWGKWAPRLTPGDLARWPADVSDYLGDVDAHKGYNILELETGVSSDVPLVRGELRDALLEKAREASADFAQLRSPAEFPFHQPPVAAQGSSPGSGLFSFDAFSSLSILLETVRQDVEEARGNNEHRNLFLVPRCRVHRLDHRGGRVVGLHVLVGEPMMPRYLPLSHKTRVVMALNSMESTRLALLSQLPEPSPASPLTGRNLSVHLRSNFTMRMPREALGALSRKLQPAALHVQGDNGSRRFHFQLFAAADREFDAHRLLYKMMPDQENLRALLEAQQSDFITLRVLTCGELLGNPAAPVGTPGTSSVRLATPQDGPEWRDVIGGVEIPKIFVDWQNTNAGPDDDFWEAMDRMAFDFVKGIAGDHLAEIRYPDHGGGAWMTSLPSFRHFRDSLSSTFHEAGTLWMGEDPATSVTATNGRFHRVANLYCVDQAVFPTGGSANPVLTGLTITRKVVDGILTELGLRKPPIRADESDQDMTPPWNR